MYIFELLGLNHVISHETSFQTIYRYRKTIENRQIIYQNIDICWWYFSTKVFSRNYEEIEYFDKI